MEKRNKIYAYLRVSSLKQTTDNQKLAIVDYTQKNNLSVDKWISVDMSTSKSVSERKLTEMIEMVKDGDTVIITEITRIGRSVKENISTLESLFYKGVEVRLIKEQMTINKHNQDSISNDVMITVFSLCGQIGKKLLSQRTKEGLARAKAEGKILGKPKGTIQASKLDSKINIIKELLDYGVPKSKISRQLDVTPKTLYNFMQKKSEAFKGYIKKT